MNWAAWGGSVALAILTLALILTAYRLLKGPNLSDRVIALDSLAVIAVMIMACLSVVTENPVLLDACLSIALLAFISTVAFARYMERQQ
jgi:multicomponent Na+:H+ antiporter subunit F